MSKVIEISALKKRFGSVQAVDDISFDVNEGSLFAFLGLNGAGKSTTINIICTLLPKDEGKVNVAGFDLDVRPDMVRESIGVVFQNAVLDNSLSVYDNLCVRASFYGIYGNSRKERLAELSKILSLDEIMKRPYGKLSGGQRRRVDVARGLIHSPKILILDEPTTGLDPQTRKTVWNVIENLRKELGMTVFLTTHYMEEASSADDVVILDAGKIAARGTPKELKETYSYDLLTVYSSRNEFLDKAFGDLKFLYENGAYRVNVLNGEHAKRILNEYGAYIPDFELKKGDMDDVFLNVTGKTLVGGEQ